MDTELNDIIFQDLEAVRNYYEPLGFKFNSQHQLENGNLVVDLYRIGNIMYRSHVTNKEVDMICN